ncbi:MAG: hypothetical protein ACXABY_16430 [Candidatus Thorarchaeota archaeon]|jgi:hypothetical protein
MNRQKIREALSAMCYREEMPGRWCKPIGTHLFTYEEDRNEWTNWFKGRGDTIERWQSKHPTNLETGGPFLGQLKDWEQWTKISCGAPSEFELSPDIEMYLGL